MAVGVLGPLRVDDGDVQLGVRDRTVLAALTVRSGEVRTPDQLADALWGENPPASSAKNLQGCVSRLRKVLGPDAIQTSPQGYRLTVPPDTVDAWQFEQLVDRARELLTLREPERARFTADRALALWRGPPLTELEDWAPGALEAVRLTELHRDAEELRLDAALQSGHHREVLVQAQTMVQEAPLRERRWALLARAQYQSGRQAEALRTLHRLRKMLAEELGLDPAPDVVALEQAILQQDPTLAVETTSPSGSESCPYLGLAAYDEDDAESFFGRDAELDQCLARLAEHGVLAVVGPSGSGKSSIVRAGVAVALRRQGRRVRVIVPGRHPMDVFADAPRGSPPALLVDQAEELFSVCDDQEERDRFIDALTEYAERAPVVLAFRADRMGDVAANPALARMVEQGLFLLGSMSVAGLRAAVEGPARQSGLVVEPGLVDLLVREVEGEAGALPLLSHTLRETWLRREGRTLTVAGYQASGGVRGAVSQSAEKLYATVPESERNLLRDLMMRLVAPGAEGEPVRSRMPRRNVVADPVQDGLIDQLVRARLVTLDGDLVELAHESLARAWPRLRGWLDDDVAGRRILHHLVASADAWDTLGRPGSELYRGVRLTTALTWRETSDPELTRVEQDFLAASQDAAAAEERSAAEHARQQSRMIRRLRITLAGAGVLLALALVAGFVAVQQTRNAEASATTSDAQRVGALSLITDDIDESMLLAVAGVRLDDSPETQSNLLAALARRPELVSSLQTPGAPVLQMDVSPDGERVVTQDVNHHLRLYDLGTRRLLGEFQAGQDLPLSWVSGNAVFSPDGTMVAVNMSGPAQKPVVLLDGGDLEPLRYLDGPTPGETWQVQDVSWSADGRYLAGSLWPVKSLQLTAQTSPASAVVWRVPGPAAPVTTIPLGNGTSASVALSPRGDKLYTTRPLAIHELATGTTTRIQGAPEAFRMSVSPDGRLLGISFWSDVWLFDARSGELVRRLPMADGDSPYLIRFSADGEKVAARVFGTDDALVWEVASGTLLARIPVGEQRDPLDFGPDGSTLFTAGDGAAVREWDLDGARRFVQQIGVARGVDDFGHAQVAPGGGRVAYMSGDDLRFLDVRSGAMGPGVPRPSGDLTVKEGVWHPDGDHFAMITGKTVAVYDAASDVEVGTWRPEGSRPLNLDYGADGHRLVVVTTEGLQLLDGERGKPVGTAVPFEAAACAVSLAPDNSTAVVLAGPPEVTKRFWLASCDRWTRVDLSSGEVLARGELPITDARRVEVSPDGRHAAFAGEAGQVLVVNLDTGSLGGSLPAPRPSVFIRVLTYSRDGQLLLTAGNDTVELWDGVTGHPVARLTIPDRYLGAGLEDDGYSVLIPSEGRGPIYRWDTRTESAIAFACKVAGRSLTRAEWSKFFGDRPYEETCPGY